ncbi:lysylphosphatidylglycerol synthase domain-containing protein [Humibacillus xanthopallidus]|uniref:lysylphosphatidylglycerol synthase domain-containing protein n=1 Tax=Humibacillus xanthopallidus TaxID=412689 RepID=UPI00114F7269|nr:lysylphosphatidylglycerol synthase domain-containing protein [Humibacillus xanthopallidus]
MTAGRTAATASDPDLDRGRTSTGGGPGRSTVHRSRYLVATDDQPRVRRASDLTTIVIGLALFGWSVATLDQTSDLTATPSTQPVPVAPLPTWTLSLLQLVNTLALVYALGVVVVLALAHRRSAVRDVLTAAALVVLVTLACVAAFDQLWPALLPEYATDGVPPQFPVLRVAMVAAVLLAASPHLARPIRQLGWALVIMAGVAAPALGFGRPSGAMAGVGIGMFCAGGILLAFGSPRGYPAVASVAEALTDLGLPLTNIRVDPDQSWGVRRMIGVAADGGLVEIKAFGRDATDSQLAAKVWRAIVYRGEGVTLSLSRLQAAEHEALVTVLARRAGVRVPEVLAAASTSGEVAVLATSRGGTRLDTLDPETVSDAELVRLWRDVARLHEAGITHGSLDPAAVRLDDGVPVITNFSAGSLHRREHDRQLDIARLLFGLAQLVGVDRAVSTAHEGLGSERLGAALAYLQAPAIPSRERRHSRTVGRELKALRAGVVEQTGVQVPEPVKLRRVGPRDVLTLVVLLLFVGALIPVLAGVDYEQLWAELQGATWWIIVAAVVLGQLVFVPQAASMMFAVGRSLPLRPATILQSAIAFISFAIPGVAGRVTMNAAFLYKYGVTPAVAVTQGAIDGLSGFIVQVILVLLAFATGSVAFDIAATSSSDIDLRLVLAFVILLAGVALLAVWKVKRVHDRVVPVVASAWGALVDLMKAPARALGLFGVQLVIQLAWGLMLSAALYAVGSPLDLLPCTVVVVATSLFQGIVPVPGGIGVSEALMVGLLVPLGVPSDVAMAATVVWRVATFYLPATEGFFASRWLERRGYL